MRLLSLGQSSSWVNCPHPATFCWMAITPEAHREWELAHLRLYPRAASLLSRATCCTRAVTLVTMRWTLGLTKLDGVVIVGQPGVVIMLFTQWARVLTGQNHLEHAVWWIVALRCPFCWLSIQSMEPCLYFHDLPIGSCHVQYATF